MVLSLGVFVSFAVAAMVSKRREWLFLGGLLSTMLWGLLIASFLRFFIYIPAFNLIHAMLGLGVAALYVMFDVQLAVERAVREPKADVLRDALSLHLNLIKIFVEVLRILIEMQRKRKDGEKKRERK